MLYIFWHILCDDEAALDFVLHSARPYLHHKGNTCWAASRKYLSIALHLARLGVRRELAISQSVVQFFLFLPFILFIFFLLINICVSFYYFFFSVEFLCVCLFAFKSSSVFVLFIYLFYLCIYLFFTPEFLSVYLYFQYTPATT